MAAKAQQYAVMRRSHLLQATKRRNLAAKATESNAPPVASPKVQRLALEQPARDAPQAELVL